MNGHAKPDFPNEIWSGGFWYGLAAACLYFGLTVCLSVNLIGYIRGHYPQHFELTEDQRTLIIQTVFYYLWIAGAAGVYSRVESWHFVDAVRLLSFVDRSF
jgi:potassium channel subfamily K